MLIGEEDAKGRSMGTMKSSDGLLPPLATSSACVERRGLDACKANWSVPPLPIDGNVNEPIEKASYTLRCSFPLLVPIMMAFTWS